jgi:hypothetical protein
VFKGNNALQRLTERWSMPAFPTVAGSVALKRYRQTLD